MDVLLNFRKQISLFQYFIIMGKRDKTNRDNKQILVTTFLIQIIGNGVNTDIKTFRTFQIAMQIGDNDNQ